MNLNFLHILVAVTIVSLISFIGIIFFRGKFLKKRIYLFVSFAAGSLIGAALFDLIPEALTGGFKDSTAFFILIGILSFFVLEKFLHWHHHHIGEKETETHAFTYLNLIGSAVHNFTDGAIIAVSFLNSTKLGIIATIAIIAHEIPHEFGDYAILIYGGFSQIKAAVYNFISALAAILGAILAYLFSSQLQFSGIYISAFEAGGFIYIAGTDLIPEIHKEKEFRKSIFQFIFLLGGVLLIYFVGKIFEGG